VGGGVLEVTESLITLADKLREVTSEVEDGGGEVDDELERRLDAALMQVDNKVEAIAVVYRRLKADVQIAKDEAQLMKDRAKSHERNAERLRDYVGVCLRRAGLRRVDAARAKAWLQLGAPSARMADPTNPPAGCTRWRVSGTVPAGNAEIDDLVDELEKHGLKCELEIDPRAAVELVKDRIPEEEGTWTFDGVKVNRKVSVVIQ
jgi:hypothetical protein